MKLIPLAVCLILPTIAPAQDVAALGRKLPALQTEQWIGGPAVAFEADRVYVAYYWYARCAPCVHTLSAIGELQTDFAGKVTFYGITPQALGIEKVLQRQKLSLPTGVAATADISATLVEVIGQDNYPVTIVHRGSGEILAAGDPRSGTMLPPPPGPIATGSDASLAPLRAILERILAGGADPEQRAREAALATREAKLREELALAKKFNDRDEQLVILDKLVALGPARVGYAAERITLLAADRANRDAAWTYGVAVLRQHGYDAAVVDALRDAALRRGKPEPIAERYEHLVEIGPEFAPLAIEAYEWRRGRNLAAEAYAKALIQKHGGHAELMLGLARSGSKGRHTEVALGAAQAVLRADAENFAALTIAANALFEAKRFGEAAPLLEKAAERAEDAGERAKLTEKAQWARVKSRN